MAKEYKVIEGIYNLFLTKEVKGSKKYRWGRIFASPLPVIAEALEPLALQQECTQQAKRDHILWFGKSAKPEAMFCFVPDPTNLAQVKKVYMLISKTLSPVTFVIVHQRSDGEGCYDIFRLSQRSYLEHHNRVYNRK